MVFFGKNWIVEGRIRCPLPSPFLCIRSVLGSAASRHPRAPVSPPILERKWGKAYGRSCPPLSTALLVGRGHPARLGWLSIPRRPVWSVLQGAPVTRSSRPRGTFPLVSTTGPPIGVAFSCLPTFPAVPHTRSPRFSFSVTLLLTSCLVPGAVHCLL